MPTNDQRTTILAYIAYVDADDFDSKNLPSGWEITNKVSCMIASPADRRFRKGYKMEIEAEIKDGAKIEDMKLALMGALGKTWIVEDTKRIEQIRSSVIKIKRGVAERNRGKQAV